MKRPHFALPEIYDDSLSYYDVLRKLIKSMHVISDNLNKIPEQIANEAKARLLGDQNLQQNINSEATTREQGDTALQQNINSEATTREQADQEIREVVSNKISELKGDLSAEQKAREQADTSLQQEISGKLPKSPANWEPWTADEQAAARDRIGIPGDYELIDTITIDEDSILDFTLPYPCKNALVIGKTKKFAAKQQNGYFKINRNVNYPAPFDGIPNTYTTNKVWTVEIMTNGTYTTTINTNSDNIYLCGVQKSTRNLVTVQSISSLQSSIEFLAGTELIVYGVRA